MKISKLSLAILVATGFTATAANAWVFGGKKESTRADHEVSSHLERMIKRAGPVTLTGGGDEAPQVQIKTVQKAEPLPVQQQAANELDKQPVGEPAKSQKTEVTSESREPSKESAPRVSVFRKVWRAIGGETPVNPRNITIPKAADESIATAVESTQQVAKTSPAVTESPLAAQSVAPSASLAAYDSPADAIVTVQKNPPSPQAEVASALTTSLPEQVATARTERSKPGAFSKLLAVLIPPVEVDVYDAPGQGLLSRRVAAASIDRPPIKAKDHQSYDIPESAKEREKEVLERAAKIIASPEKTVDLVAPKNVPETKKKEFLLPSGQRVDQAIQSWAKEEGWTVRWKLNTSWISPVDTTFYGEFEEVLQEIVTALYNEGKQIRLMMWTNRYAEIVDVSTR